MKHLKKFENIENKGYVYIIHWNDEGGALEAWSEGYLQKNSDRISADDVSDDNLVLEIMKLDINEKFYNENERGEQILNGYIDYIEKVQYLYEEEYPDFNIKVFGKKYNI